MFKSVKVSSEAGSAPDRVVLVDEKGQKKRKATPLYDGTLGDADAAFKLLASELKLRGAAKAKELILVADVHALDAAAGHERR